MTIFICREEFRSLLSVSDDIRGGINSSLRLTVGNSQSWPPLLLLVAIEIVKVQPVVSFGTGQHIGVVLVHTRVHALVEDGLVAAEEAVNEGLFSSIGVLDGNAHVEDLALVVYV